MNKIFFPVAAAAILLLTTSCGEDTKGTSFEVTNANHDENVNPANIRGYGVGEPHMPGSIKNTSQYYPFNTATLPEEARRNLEGGNIATQMVTVYYSASRSLEDLAKEHNPNSLVGSKTTGSQPAPASSAPTPASNNNSGSSDGNTSSGEPAGNGNNQSGSGNKTDQQ